MSVRKITITDMNTLPSVEVFIKNLSCFNTTLTPFLQAEVGKTRNTLRIWEHGVPPVLPSTHQQGHFWPRPAACFPPRENRVFPMYHHIACCHTFLRETENLSQQPEIHGNLSSPTINVTLLQSSPSGVT